MNLIVFFSLLSIISFTNLISSVLIISMEGLLGGKAANPNQINYQVAILRRSIETGKVGITCSGGIIARNFIMSIAKCFLDDRCHLRNYEFSIKAGTINWKKSGIQRLIHQIFVPDFNDNNCINNIAIASLTIDLDTDSTSDLSELVIPKSADSFYMDIANVSGYGAHHITYKPKLASSATYQLRRLRARSDGFLRQAEVLISFVTTCAFQYANIDISIQFCGIIFNHRNETACGLCDNDVGSPIVLNNTIIGLASSTHYDCNDTIYGTAYTKVSAFSHFANSIISNDTLAQAVTYNNKRYNLFPVAHAA